MKKIAILSLSLLVTGVGTFLPGMVRAADESTASSSQNPVAKDHEGMMGGDMQTMSKMMAQMNQMMDKCDKMMQKMDDRKTK